MKRNKLINSLITLFIICYLAIDIPHFLMYRINPVYLSCTEAFFESHIVSYIKWFFCAMLYMGLVLDMKNKSISFYLLSLPSVAILLLFIVNGPMVHIFMGSLVSKYGLLEIIAVISLINCFIVLFKKYKIPLLRVILILSITIVLLYLLFYQLPTYSLSK